MGRYILRTLMRIIAGEFRGRRLLGPEDESTRPITDRAKQSLFDILTPLLADARVYDCFAGTGSMGLECLSRGAAHSTFFESGRSAAIRLRKNIETLGAGKQSKVISSDIFGWAKWAAHAGGDRASLMFLDPPYRFLRERPEALRELVGQFARNHLGDESVIVFRHDGRDRLELPGWLRYDERSYGTMYIELLRRADHDSE